MLVTVLSKSHTVCRLCHLCVSEHRRYRRGESACGWCATGAARAPRQGSAGGARPEGRQAEKQHNIPRTPKKKHVTHKAPPALEGPPTGQRTAARRCGPRTAPFPPSEGVAFVRGAAGRQKKAPERERGRETKGREPASRRGCPLPPSTQQAPRRSGRRARKHSRWNGDGRGGGLSAVLLRVHVVVVGALKVLLRLAAVLPPRLASHG